MDMFSYYSDPLPLQPDYFSTDHFIDYSSVSDAATTTSPSSSTVPPATYSDEDTVMLASSYPKKRAGRKKFQETRHPVYRGVRKRNSGKWVSEVREPNKKSRIWLGTYLTEEMAARAHDVAAIALRGRSACLNFADSAWRLPLPASTDPKDIQKAAAQAAEAFRPMPNSGPHFETTVNQTGEEEEEEDEEEQRVPEQVSYMDDEYDIFGMPGLLANMAEGLMLPPPHYSGDEVEYGTDVSLWSYSV